jgi:hypothetical protein
MHNRSSSKWEPSSAIGTGVMKIDGDNMELTADFDHDGRNETYTLTRE